MNKQITDITCQSLIVEIFMGVLIFLSINFIPFYAAESMVYIHSDHLGSSSWVTKDGNLISEERYYPYGTTRAKTGDMPTERQFTGQISDVDQTGLYYYNARYYNPVLAKFTQPDPVNDQQNRYTYVGNNPVNTKDPSGNAGEDTTGVVPCYYLGNCNPNKTAAYPASGNQQKPSSAGQYLQAAAARVLTAFGLIDLTPNSWGLKNYVSKDEYLTAQAGLSLPGPMAMTMPYRSVGAKIANQGKMATTYINVEEGTVTKIFNFLMPENSFQAKMYQKFAGKVPGVTYLGEAPAELGEGFVQKYHPGVGFKEYISSGGEVTEEMVKQATNDLAQIHAVSGTAHGDLARFVTNEAGELVPKANFGNIYVTNPASSSLRRIMPLDLWGAGNQYTRSLSISSLRSSDVMQTELTAYQAILTKYITIK